MALAPIHPEIVKEELLTVPEDRIGATDSCICNDNVDALRWRVGNRLFEDFELVRPGPNIAMDKLHISTCPGSSSVSCRDKTKWYCDSMHWFKNCQPCP